MTRRPFLLAAVVLALAAPAGAASSTTIEAADNVFKPVDATVSVGDTVVWKNTGESAHEVTASAFSSGNIAKGASWSWKASKAGTFSYVCRYHESVGMKGTLVVKTASTTGNTTVGGTAGHPKTGGSSLPLGLLVIGVAAVGGLSLRYGWRTR